MKLSTNLNDDFFCRMVSKSLIKPQQTGVKTDRSQVRSRRVQISLSIILVSGCEHPYPDPKIEWQIPKHRSGLNENSCYHRLTIRKQIFIQAQFHQIGCPQIPKFINLCVDLLRHEAKGGRGFLIIFVRLQVLNCPQHYTSASDEIQVSFVRDKHEIQMFGLHGMHPFES